MKSSHRITRLTGTSELDIGFASTTSLLDCKEVWSEEPDRTSASNYIVTVRTRDAKRVGLAETVARFVAD